MSPENKVVSDNFIEIERRFLITDIDFAKLSEAKNTRIEQIFLLSRDPNMDRSVRKEESDGGTRYFLVEKYITSRPVIRFNRKEEITARKFQTLKRRIDANRGPAKKNRFSFYWKGQSFRIDKYDGPMAGLLMLEAVLSDENEEVQIPDFCTVLKEVTGEKEYHCPAVEDLKDDRTKPRIAKRNASFYIVAMVDLLGQGAQLERFWGIPKTAKEKKAFDRLARLTFGTVEQFRDRIRLLQGSLPRAHVIPPVIEERLTKRQLKILRRDVEPLIGYQFFTDLALLTMNLSGQRGHRLLVSLYSLLFQLGLLILTQLAEGVLIRGAVDVGICTELQDGDLYGQAIGRAYTLESQVAVSPRIVIGEALVDYINSFENLRGSSDERAIAGEYVNVLRQCLRQDRDGATILSYLAPVFRSSFFPSNNEFRFVTRSACRSIAALRDRLSQEVNPYLGLRIERLEDYFRSEGCWAEAASRRNGKARLRRTTANPAKHRDT
jgi:CYTH domain-containing protein